MTAVAPWGKSLASDSPMSLCPFRLWFGVLALAVVTCLHAQTATAPQLYGISGGGAVEMGGATTLEVFFSGTGMGQSYQWQKDAKNIPSATATTYALPAVTAADAGVYTIQVTNSAGTSAASVEVVVKPLAPPVILYPPSGMVTQVGQSVTFSYTATGSYPRTHQWRRNGVDI